jgi:hypothetical protein
VALPKYHGTLLMEEPVVIVVVWVTDVVETVEVVVVETIEVELVVDLVVEEDRRRVVETEVDVEVAVVRTLVVVEEEGVVLPPFMMVGRYT